MIAMLAVMAQMAVATAAPPADTRLKVDMRSFTSLPNYGWNCDLGPNGMMRLDIDGPPKPHARLAMIVSSGKARINGLADNDYAPRAIVLSSRTGLNESFRIKQGKATYYLLLSWDIDHPVDKATLDEVVPVSTGRIDITRRADGMPMAKPFAAGQCRMIGDAVRG